MLPTNKDEIYAKNFAILKERYPELAQKIESTNFSKWSFVDSGKSKKLNLEANDHATLYINEINIESAMRYWAAQLDFKNKNILVVYGLGLGYYYPYVKKWVHSVKWHKLYILEDDLEIIHHFLFLEEASLLLGDKQVIIELLGHLPQELAMKDLGRRTIFKGVNFVASPGYAKSRAKEFFELKFLFNYFWYNAQVFHGNYVYGGEDFFQNFWKNCNHIPQAGALSKLKNSFKGIPAILCGAGPSLKKNAHLLNEFKDKALIIAGGTSVNVLNSYGIDPHLTIGFDPYVSAFARTQMSTSFEEPLLFKPRLNKKVLETSNPNLIYISGGARFDVEGSLDQALGVENVELNLGSNVVTASTSIAQFLGCSPLILVGLDLAYTEGESYGNDLPINPYEVTGYKTRGTHEEIIERVDIFGKPIKTLMKWINESFWYTEFQTNYPDVQLINSTEGGIGFVGVHNIPLKDVLKSMNQPLDISGKLHAKLQESAMTINEDWKSYVKTLENDLAGFVLWASETERKDNKIFRTHDIEKFPEVNAVLKSFKSKSFWKDILQEFSLIYERIMDEISDEEVHMHPLTILYPGYISFIKNVALINLKYIQNDFDYHHETSKPVAKFNEPAELGEENFYSENKQLLASAAFLNGKKEGPAKRWYLSGQLYADLNYKKGLLDGIQKYYYENGQLKSELSYASGILDGEVKLFWPNEKPLRQVNFIKGKREGKEVIWNRNGVLLFEAFYTNNTPVEKVSVYSEKGHLIHQKIYTALGLLESSKDFDENGKELVSEEKTHDFIDRLGQNTDTLTSSLNSLYTTVEAVAEAADIKMLNENLPSLNLEDEILNLKNEMEKLTDLGNQLKAMSEETDLAQGDQIWRSKEFEDYLSKEVINRSDEMKDVCIDLELIIRSLKKDLKDNENDKDKA